MKMKIDRKYVEDYQLARVKEDAAEFKGRYTDGDLVRSYMNQMDDYRMCNAEVIYCKAEAMDSGWACGNRTIFCIEIMLENHMSIYKIRFYSDMDLNIDTRDNMVMAREFKDIG